MRTHVTVSEAARQLICRPRDISDALYHRLLPDESCPIVGGRRMIPVELLPGLRELLGTRAAVRQEVAHP